WQCAERYIGGRQRKHDQESRQHETKASDNTAGQSSLGVPEIYAKLGCARSWQHIYEREAFDKLRLLDPPALFLDLRLHYSHDGGSAIAHGPNLQKDPCDFFQTHVSLAHVKAP